MISISFVFFVGVGLIMRSIAKNLKPKITFTIDGNKWKILSESTFRNHAWEFELDKEFMETTPDGRQVKVITFILIIQFLSIFILFNKYFIEKICLLLFCNIFIQLNRSVKNDINIFNKSKQSSLSFFVKFSNYRLSSLIVYDYIFKKHFLKLCVLLWFRQMISSIW